MSAIKVYGSPGQERARVGVREHLSRPTELAGFASSIMFAASLEVLAAIMRPPEREQGPWVGHSDRRVGRQFGRR